MDTRRNELPLMSLNRFLQLQQIRYAKPIDITIQDGRVKSPTRQRLCQIGANRGLADSSLATYHRNHLDAGRRARRRLSRLGNFASSVSLFSGPGYYPEFCNAGKSGFYEILQRLTIIIGDNRPPPYVIDVDVDAETFGMWLDSDILNVYRFKAAWGN